MTDRHRRDHFHPNKIVLDIWSDLRLLRAWLMKSRILSSDTRQRWTVRMFVFGWSGL